MNEGTRRIRCAVSIILVAVGVFVGAQVRGEGSEPCFDLFPGRDELPILAWYGIPAEEATVERFAEMKEAGFNLNLSMCETLTGARKVLDCANAVGIRCIVDIPDLKTNLTDVVKAVKGHPALAGYYLEDEPSYLDYPRLGDLSRRLRTLDRQSFHYLNLLPNYDFSKKPISYREYVKRGAENVPTEMLSFDHYGIQYDPKTGRCSLRPTYYENLDVFAAESRRVGRPFWAFSLAAALFNYPVPTPEMIRFQMYMNLAYGAQGLQYFTYWHLENEPAKRANFHDSPIDASGRRTAVWRAIREVNAEIQRRAFVFKGATVRGTWHVAKELPSGARPLESLPTGVLKLDTNGRHAVVSLLSKNGFDYLVVVNAAFRRDSLDLAVDFSGAAERILPDGSAVRVTDASAYCLPPGGCEIFRLPARGPKGIRTTGDGVAPDDPLESVVPYPLDYEGGPERLARRLLAVRDLSGISRFALYAPRHVVRLTGAKTPADYAAYGKTLRELSDTLKPRGLSCGFLAMPTVNIGIRHPGGDYVCEDGTVRPFTGCPQDPAFRALFVSNMTEVAAIARPPFLMLEDDFRFFGRGCFCAEHLKAFAEATGRRWTREEVRTALAKSDSGMGRKWFELQTDALVTLAAELEHAVGAVSPETRIGLSAPGGLNESDSLRIARAAAGARRPFVRWYGTGYGADVPIDCCGYLRSAQWAREHLDGHEFFYEADAVPHTVMYSSAARQMALMEKTFAMGFDRMWFWGVGTGADDLAESPDFLVSYRDRILRFAEIRRLGHTGRLIGVSANAGWYAPLNRMGFPVTTADASVRFVSGADAFAGMSDAEVRKMLSGRVVLDGAAASEAVTRGFGNLLGIKSCGRALSGFDSSRFDSSCRVVDFSGERMVDGSWTSGHFECAYHQSYGLDRSRIADLRPDGAEEVSYYFLETPERRVRPSVLKFANAAGGRVVVMASFVSGIQSPNFFNFAKRRMLADLIVWLGGDDALPIRVASGPNAYVLARETPEGLFTHVTNLSCDMRRSYAFAVAPQWRNGGVELLDEKGRWRVADHEWTASGRLLLSTGAVPVFSSLAFRIGNSTVSSFSGPQIIETGVCSL